MTSAAEQSPAEESTKGLFGAEAARLNLSTGGPDATGLHSHG